VNTTPSVTPAAVSQVHPIIVQRKTYTQSSSNSPAEQKTAEQKTSSLLASLRERQTAKNANNAQQSNNFEEKKISSEEKKISENSRSDGGLKLMSTLLNVVEQKENEDQNNAYDETKEIQSNALDADEFAMESMSTTVLGHFSIQQLKLYVEEGLLNDENPSEKAKENIQAELMVQGTSLTEDQKIDAVVRSMCKNIDINATKKIIGFLGTEANDANVNEIIECMSLENKETMIDLWNMCKNDFSVIADYAEQLICGPLHSNINEGEDVDSGIGVGTFLEDHDSNALIGRIETYLSNHVHIDAV
jgi:hypothetical protein